MQRGQPEYAGVYGARTTRPDGFFAVWGCQPKGLGKIGIPHDLANVSDGALDLRTGDEGLGRIFRWLSVGFSRP